MNSEIKVFIKNYNGEVRVKGFSFDNNIWNKLPKDYQPLSNHPELSKYAVIKAIDGKDNYDRYRNATIRLTNKLRSLYLKDNKFFFKDKELEIDENTRDDSIASLIQEPGN